MRPGYWLKAPAETPRSVGRPRKEVPEGALPLGEPRFRWCDSKKRIADEQRMRRCKLTMMSTFHNVEEATLGECQKHMGLFVTLTEENLRKLGQEVRDGSSDEDVEQVTPMQEDAVGRAEAYLELLGSLPDRVAGLAGLTTQVMQRHPNDEAAKTEADAEAVEALTFIRERNEKVEEDLKSMQKEVGRDGCGL